MEQYKVPPLCANCGTEPGTKPWLITQTSMSVSPFTLLGMFFGIGVMNRRTITFTVPIGEICWEKYQEREKLRKDLNIGCAVFSLIGVILWVILAQTRNENALLASFIVVIVIALGIQIISALIRIIPGSYNGKYFKFKNARFHEEFARLNTHLVKPSRRQ